MKSPALNSCFLTGAAALVAVTGLPAGTFGAWGRARVATLAGAALGGGAFGCTSLSAGPGTFFFTATVISKTFQSPGTKRPNRPELCRWRYLARTETCTAQSEAHPQENTPEALREQSAATRPKLAGHSIYIA